MLKYLRDPANLITVSGIVLSGAALSTIVAGRLELAIALGLWAMLADQIDGLVAKTIPCRDTRTASIGKQLDGYGDIIYGAVLPALTIISATAVWPPACIVAVGMLIAGALRLSYFSIFGTVDGKFLGLPLSYDLPLLALVFLLRPWIANNAFVLALAVLGALLALLHVAPIRVPAPRGAAYLSIGAACLVLSAAHLIGSA